MKPVMYILHLDYAVKKEQSLSNKGHGWQRRSRVTAGDGNINSKFVKKSRLIAGGGNINSIKNKNSR